MIIISITIEFKTFVKSRKCKFFSAVVNDKKHVVFSLNVYMHMSINGKILGRHCNIHMFSYT